MLHCLSIKMFSEVALLRNFMITANICQFCLNILNGSVETVASSSFIFVNESKTWSKAQSYCREHYTDLASVRNQTENEQIKKMILSQFIWLGFYRDSWKWSDGSPTSFINWNPEKNLNGRPCVVLHQGRWEDGECDSKLYFVCHVGEL